MSSSDDDDSSSSSGSSSRNSKNDEEQQEKEDPVPTFVGGVDGKASTGQDDDDDDDDGTLNTSTSATLTVLIPPQPQPFALPSRVKKPSKNVLKGTLNFRLAPDAKPSTKNKCEEMNNRIEIAEDAYHSLYSDYGDLYKLAQSGFSKAYSSHDKLHEQYSSLANKKVKSDNETVDLKRKLEASKSSELVIKKQKSTITDGQRELKAAMKELDKTKKMHEKAESELNKLRDTNNNQYQEITTLKAQLKTNNSNASKENKYEEMLMRHRLQLEARQQTQQQKQLLKQQERQQRMDEKNHRVSSFLGGSALTFGGLQMNAMMNNGQFGYNRRPTLSNHNQGHDYNQGCDDPMFDEYNSYARQPNFNQGNNTSDHFSRNGSGDNYLPPRRHPRQPNASMNGGNYYEQHDFDTVNQSNYFPQQNSNYRSSNATGEHPNGPHRQSTTGNSSNYNMSTAAQGNNTAGNNQWKENVQPNYFSADGNNSRGNNGHTPGNSNGHASAGNNNGYADNYVSPGESNVPGGGGSQDDDPVSLLWNIRNGYGNISGCGSNAGHSGP